ncbi:MAG: 3-deoxy-8-phosphooctulonate synthase [Phycisphaerae bacterium]|nr:3-deoxy-8-phosphooctulonate synthase [Phycisphaerae bacterium]
MQPLELNGVRIGLDSPLTIIAGPCVLEPNDLALRTCETVQAICKELGMQFIAKASFDKANRSSLGSNRGPGLEAGLDELRRIGSTLNCPVTTDVHLPEQCQSAAEAVDLLQIPAFLCRQTDLLQAAANTGCAVNVKKGQFMSPAEMSGVLGKLENARATMLTERGTFFGYNRLINDFTGLAEMRDFGVPVCFDVTHSTQRPGAGAGVTAGRPEMAPLLARSAVAAGVDALFIECHPDPDKAASDGATVQPLERMREILTDCAKISTALKS